jgi:hypothetical protein
MRRASKMVSGILVAALLASSPAMAASTTAQAPAATAQVQSPWITLSMLTPVGAGALGGSAAVAAQPEGPPPPPPPQGGPGFPPIPVIGIWILTLAVAIWILTKNDNNGHFNFPNSPG